MGWNFVEYASINYTAIESQDEFWCGMLAFAVGLQRDDCPHPFDSPRGAWWISGWCSLSGGVSPKCPDYLPQYFVKIRAKHLHFVAKPGIMDDMNFTEPNKIVRHVWQQDVREYQMKVVNRESLRSVLSSKEEQMFVALGWDYILDNLNAEDAYSFYKMAVEKAFCEQQGVFNETDETFEKIACVVSSLRRCMNHFRKGKYRGNEEFDSLIVLE